MKKILLALACFIVLSAPASARATCQTKEVVMFETLWCPYCRQAKELFEKHGVYGRWIDIEDPTDEEKPLVKKVYKKLSRGGVPFIVIDGEFANDELVKVNGKIKGKIIDGFNEYLIREYLCIVDEDPK